MKTLWEKEKMLVTSIFSFSNNVFYSIKERNHNLSNILVIVCKCFEFGLVKKIVVNGKVLRKGSGNNDTMIYGTVFVIFLDPLEKSIDTYKWQVI